MSVKLKDLLSLGGGPKRFDYTSRDTILYALSCGLGADPCDPRQLRFTYEVDLLALPMFACVLTSGFDTLRDSGVDFAKVVHAEQRMDILKPLPAEGYILAQWAVDEVVDKGPGKGAFINHHMDICDPDGKLLVKINRTTAARGDGGLGGSPTSRFVPRKRPDREADEEIVVATLPQQALLYRLNGDRNPIHADPAAARRVGFDRPILHGLCTYGVVGAAILRHWCDFDPTRLCGFEARFAAPVFPGDVLSIKMWRDDPPSTIAFEVDVPSRGVTVMRNGCAAIE